MTFLFLKYCHIHCHEHNLSQVTLAKWIIFLTCGTNFLRVFSLLALFSSLFSGPLKKKTKNLLVLDCIFGSYSVFRSFLSLQMPEVFQGNMFIRIVPYFDSFQAMSYLLTISPSEYDSWNNPHGFYFPQANGSILIINANCDAFYHQN